VIRRHTPRTQRRSRRARLSLAVRGRVSMRGAEAIHATSDGPTSAAACEACPSPEDADVSAAVHLPSSPCSDAMGMPFVHPPAPSAPHLRTPPPRALHPRARTATLPCAARGHPQHARAAARENTVGGSRLAARRRIGVVGGGSCPRCLRGGRAVELVARGAGHAPDHEPSLTGSSESAGTSRRPPCPATCAQLGHTLPPGGAPGHPTCPTYPTYPTLPYLTLPPGRGSRALPYLPYLTPPYPTSWAGLLGPTPRHPTYRAGHLDGAPGPCSEQTSKSFDDLGSGAPDPR
jgi:hypothetical protein